MITLSGVSSIWKGGLTRQRSRLHLPPPFFSHIGGKFNHLSPLLCSGLSDIQCQCTQNVAWFGHEARGECTQLQMQPSFSYRSVFCMMKTVSPPTSFGIYSVFFSQYSGPFGVNLMFELIPRPPWHLPPWYFPCQGRGAMVALQHAHACKDMRVREDSTRHVQRLGQSRLA